MFDQQPQPERGGDDMGNHRHDIRNDMPKQFGNPSANRPEVVNIREDDETWLNAIPVPQDSASFRSDGALFKIRDRLNAKATECKGRIIAAAKRIELAMESKTSFYEKYAERAEGELKETIDFYESLGA